MGPEMCFMQFLFWVDITLTGMSVGVSYRHQQCLSEVRWKANVLRLDVSGFHGHHLPRSSLVLYRPHIQTQQVRAIVIHISHT